SRVGRDDARFHGVGQDTAEQPNGPRSRSDTASHDGFASQLLGLDGHGCLASHDVLQNLSDVRLDEILDPAIAYERNDMSFDATDIADDGARLLRATALS